MEGKHTDLNILIFIILYGMCCFYWVSLKSVQFHCATIENQLRNSEVGFGKLEGCYLELAVGELGPLSILTTGSNFKKSMQCQGHNISTIYLPPVIKGVWRCQACCQMVQRAAEGGRRLWINPGNKLLCTAPIAVFIAHLFKLIWADNLDI